MNNLTKKSAPSYPISIYIAGDLSDIRHACREFCEVGLCVTVTQAEFIYTGGSQTGARIGMINYPKFPEEPTRMREKALKLAEMLMMRCFQDSCSVEFPDETIYMARNASK